MKLSSNPTSPPTIADCRRVTFKDSTQQSSPIVVPSLSPPSQSVAASSARSENTRFALKVLHDTFHLHPPPTSPLSRVCSTAGRVQSTSVKSPVNENDVNGTASPILFDDPPSTSSRVAPPLPVIDQIRPGRSLYDPQSHRRVIGPVVSGTVSDLINHIRNASPCVSPTPYVSGNVVNPDEIDVNDSENANIPPTLPDVDLAVDNNIPSAQPRLPHQPDIAAEPPAPNPPPVDNEDPSDLDSSGDLLLQDGDLVKLTEFRGKWIDTFTSEHSWDEFTDLCVQFTSEARCIQGLYRHSRKRAARQLLNDAVVSYGDFKADAGNYFEEVFSETHCNANLLSEALRADVPNAVDDITTNDLRDEVDRVEYAHLKKIDPNAKILTPIFNTCLGAMDVPLPWKQAVTILIYKKGDPTDVSNFWPIALMSCIYKLLMGIMARQLTRWSIDTGILSAEQKSARSTEGLLRAHIRHEVPCWPGKV